jgi:hypothetical protein
LLVLLRYQHKMRVWPSEITWFSVKFIFLTCLCNCASDRRRA